MQIRIHFSYFLQEFTNAEEYLYEVRESKSCGDVLSMLKEEYGHERLLGECYLILNGAYAFRHTLLAHGDELTLVPPANRG